MASTPDQTIRQRQQPAASTVNETPRSPSSRQHERETRRSSSAGKGFNVVELFRWISFLLVINFVLSYFVTESWLWGHKGKWTNINRYKMMFKTPLNLTEQQLALYDGSDLSLPIYVAINGSVFDVSANSRIYGKGGAYNFFTGKDCARAYITGCFSQDQTHDLRGIPEERQEELKGWLKFYNEHPVYYKVGHVHHPEINPASPIPPDCRPEKPMGV